MGVLGGSVAVRALRRILLGLALAVVFAAPLGAQFEFGVMSASHQFGVRGASGPVIDITSVSLSNSTFVAGSPTGTVVGTLSTALSSGNFNGGYAFSQAPTVGGASCSPTNGAQNSAFAVDAVAGTITVAQAGLAAGSYPVCVAVAQAGVVNSPYGVPLTLVATPPGASACNTSPPSQVAAAGYTTQARCNDWTAAIPNSLGTGLSGVAECSSGGCPSGNWLTCGNSDTSYQWRFAPEAQGYFGCNAIHQITDPDYGGLTLAESWVTANLPVGGNVPSNAVPLRMDSGNNNFAFGKYVETTYRQQIHPNNMWSPTHSGGFWQYPTNGVGEVDFVEVFPNYAASCGPAGCGTPFRNSPDPGFLGPYHKFGVLLTGSWGTQGGCPSGYSSGCSVECFFIDGVPAVGDSGNPTLGTSCTIWGYISGTDTQYGMIDWGPDGTTTCYFNCSPTQYINGLAFNLSISAISNCGGAICLTLPASAGVFDSTETESVGNCNASGGGGGLEPVNVTGTGTSVDGYYPNGACNYSFSAGQWQIVGSSWPGGGISYGGSGGYVNQATDYTAYYRYYKIVTCSSWQTTGCTLGTIITTENDPRYKNHNFASNVKVKHLGNGLVAYTPPQSEMLASNAHQVHREPSVGWTADSVRAHHSRSVVGPKPVDWTWDQQHRPVDDARNATSAEPHHHGLVASWLSFLGYREAAN